jgi:hypothetical protein
VTGVVSLGLVNALAPEARPDRRPGRPLLPLIAKVLAADPPSVALLAERDVPRFLALAGQLRDVFEDLRRGTRTRRRRA